MALLCVTSQCCNYCLSFFYSLSFSSLSLSHMETFIRLIPPVTIQGRLAEVISPL